LPKQVL